MGFADWRKVPHEQDVPWTSKCLQDHRVRAMHMVPSNRTSMGTWRSKPLLSRARPSHPWDEHPSHHRDAGGGDEGLQTMSHLCDYEGKMRRLESEAAGDHV